MGYDDCEVECIDMAAHAFSCQGRNIYFNEDFGFEMEYPQGFLSQIDRGGLSRISHGSEIISPDTTVVISTYHHWASSEGFGVVHAVEVDTGWMWLDQKTCLQKDITKWVNEQIQSVTSSGGTVRSHKRHTKTEKIQLDDSTSITVSDLVLTLTGRNRKRRNIYYQTILRIYYDAHGDFLESQPPLQCFVGVEYPDKHAKVGKEIIGYIKNSCWRIQYTYY